MDTVDFSIGGVDFVYERMKPMVALKAFKHVSGILGPALGEGAAAPEGSIGDAIGKFVASLDCLPELAELFKVQCKVTRSTGDKSAQVALDKFFDLTFAGKPEDLLAWVIACARIEFGGFLDGRLPDLFTEAMGSDLASLIGSLKAG